MQQEFRRTATVIWALLVLFLTSSLWAQNENITLLGTLDEYTTYSNIWGYVDNQGNEYALLGHDQGMSIIDITNPAAPTEIDMIPGPTGLGIIWREIKVWQDYAYVVSEHTSPTTNTGIQIIDLSGLPSSASLVTNYRWPNVTESTARSHTISIDDQGFLYISGGTSTASTGGVQSGVRVFSLADPENPSPVSFWNPWYVHDTQIRNNIAFAHNIFEGGQIDIYDVTDRSNPQQIHTLTYPNGFSHQSWFTEDNNYMFTCNEINGQPINVWDISVLWDSDPNNDDMISQVTTIPVASTSIAHEIYIKGNFGYISHYEEGVKVADVSDPANPVIVGTYDTSDAWGVHAFFPSDNFVVSDINDGLYVFRFDLLTNVSDEPQTIANFQLEQNFPNPFNPSTTIRYQLEKNVPVKLSVFDVLGRTIKTLVNEAQGAGSYEVNWDATDNNGQAVSSGVYLYKLEAGDFSDSKTMNLIR